jgi:hypothetical protein
MRALLASCAAADAVSTPPSDTAETAEASDEREPEESRSHSGRNAA